MKFKKISRKTCTQVHSELEKPRIFLHVKRESEEYKSSRNYGESIIKNLFEKSEASSNSENENFVLCEYKYYFDNCR
jgi:hypothetical protein